MFRDLERTQTVFTGLAAHLAFGVSLSYRDQPTTGDGMYVSGSYFPTLGLRPALGRLLALADDQRIGTNFVAVLGYGYWQSHFGSDPGVLGRPLRVNGQALTIVGVAPRDFQGTTLGVRPLVFVPISMRGVLEPGFRGFENRQSYWAYVFGRLKTGVSLSQASAALNAVYHPIVTDVEAPLQKGISDQQMTQFRAKQVVLTPGRRGHRVRHVPGLAQHPHRAGHGHSRQRRADHGSTERRSVPDVPGHRPDRPGHHAAHRCGPVHQEPGQRDPGRPGAARRQCGHVQHRPGTDWL